ncbi:hypothetical protein H257_05104 [Aphanomyces astaci]|uniref:protein-tyrosine-phosphatase n=1 Tax=Aphanomyces astaci TaxID=112090 RepID=W4GRW7_APHAT|nr:hypothetical protein H257_05104 [Aphanomyces astaci]ETV82480.1 hypothetical protein H257_05104 [Aphanomyces astaci]|eukprot:XP_009828149.1 hypothetical protein H257_05104 [Aphanomyces astaci]
MDAQNEPQGSPPEAGSKRTKTGAFHKFWHGMLTQKYLEHDNQPAEVLRGLYIGSVGAGANWAALSELGITHILVVSETVQPAFESSRRFEYFRVSIGDVCSARIVNFFDDSNAFIARGLVGGKVLVHCFAGKSRSATLVIAYLIATHHMSYESALALVRQVRPQAQPNEGFAVQLNMYYGRQHIASSLEANTLT